MDNLYKVFIDDKFEMFVVANSVVECEKIFAIRRGYSNINEFLDKNPDISNNNFDCFVVLSLDRLNHLLMPFL